MIPCRNSKARILFLALIIQFLFFTSCFAAKYSFAVFGDNRSGDAVFTDLINKINKDSDIIFAINTGDLTNTGSEKEYDNYWKMTRSAKVKIYDTLGNHDVGVKDRGIAIFKEKYGSNYYYFDHENVRFILLDNTVNIGEKGFGKKQAKWLKNLLKTNKKVFVFMHKPLFDPTGTFPNYVMIPRSANNELSGILKAPKVKAVFAGHIHGYGREVKKGVLYIVTAGAGAPLYLSHSNGGFNHYIKITVDGDKIMDEVVKLYE